MPFFSVIIPSYNREALIGATLDTVFAQTLSDFEVIVVDDGSTDKTLDVVRSYGDRVKLLTQKNSGPGAARNLAVSVATGEYLAMLDSDDLWFPWTLDTYRQVIEQEKSPAIVVGKPLVFIHPNVPTGDKAPLQTLRFKDYLDSGDEWRWFSVSSFVIRRESFERVGGFCSQGINGEDADLMMRLGVEPGFIQVTSPHTFAYRDHTGNVMKNLQKSVDGLVHALDQEDAGQHPGGAARQLERWRIIARTARSLSITVARLGMRQQAWMIYRRTLRWQMKLGKWRYVAAFPPIAASSIFRAKR